jgi:hypothetical protein
VNTRNITERPQRFSL